MAATKAERRAREALNDLVDAATTQPDGQAIYAGAVGYVATILRPRFESGELRGWLDGDEDLVGWRQELDATGKPILDEAGRPRLVRRSSRLPPPWRIERACSRHFITSPEVGLLVLRFASKTARSERWDWNCSCTQSLLGAAESLMARDVLGFARAVGWCKAKPGEDRVPVARWRAVRGSMTACPTSRRAAGQAARRGAA